MRLKKNFLFKPEAHLITSDFEYQDALRIRRYVFINEQKIPEEIEIDEYENQCEHFLLVAVGKPAATGRIRIKNSFIKFERMATLKEFRAQGLGRLLMETMLAHAQEKHPTLMPYLHSQIGAVPFYEKLGWKTQGDAFYEAEISHKIMTFLKVVDGF